MPDRIEVLTPEAALDEADRPRAADAFILDADLARPGGGLSLLTDLRSRPGTRHAALLFAHRADDAGTGAAALDMGANDLVPIDADPAEMAIRLRTQLGRKREADRLRRTVEDGMRLAATDALTGLFNRRYALAYLERVAREAAARQGAFAVMVADIDHFKRINDLHGHAAGDAVLARRRPAAARRAARRGHGGADRWRGVPDRHARHRFRPRPSGGRTHLRADRGTPAWPRAPACPMSR